MGTTQSDPSTKTKAAQTKLLYDQAPLSTLISLINAALVFFLLWEFMPQVFLLIWLAALLVISLIRIAIYRVYWRRHGEHQAPDRWLRLYLIGAYASGALWGLLIYVAASQNLLWLQGFIGFITAGMTAGGLISMAAVRAACIPYSLLITAPFIIAMLQSPDRLHLIMAAMAFLYFLLLLRTSIQLHRTHLQSLRGQMESDELYDFLQKSRRDIEDLNQSLIAELHDYSQLRQQREHFFDHATAPFCVIDTGGRIRLSNPAFEKLTGMGVGELRNMPLTELAHPEDRQQIDSALGQLEQGARKLKFRCRFRCANDRVIPLLWHASAHDGHLYALGWVLREKTGQQAPASAN